MNQQQLSRSDRYGKKKSNANEQLPKDFDENYDITKLPTRKELFPSQRIKLTRLFYNSLLYVFIAIMLILLWWGLSDTPVTD